MPELPEVEVVRRGLGQWTADREVVSVHVAHPRAVRRHFPGPDDFSRALVGQRLPAPQRRGKFLWWDLAPVALVAHLGMSGQFRVDADPGPHTRIVLQFADGTVLLFDDQRTFGGMWLDPLVGALPDSLGHVAADPFDPGFRRSAVVRRIRSRRAGVKSLILDQGVVSGIGNIYADEALWRTRLHWATPGGLVSARRASALLDEATAVMREALEAGGTSFDSLYVSVNGSSGYFQRSLVAYGQQDRPCPRCGAFIVREAFANRSSYRCPRCQRPPRLVPRRSDRRWPGPPGG